LLTSRAYRPRRGRCGGAFSECGAEGRSSPQKIGLPSLLAPLPSGYNRAGDPQLAQRQFEPLSRTIDDIQTDLRELRKLLAERGVRHVLIMNALSTSGGESIFTYAPFSQALGDELPSVRAKELNLMLHDLAEETDIAIVDVDSIAAGLGAAAHLPDGVHQSGPMQDEVRGEILHILEQREFFALPRAQTIS